MIFELDCCTIPGSYDNISMTRSPHFKEFWNVCWNSVQTFQLLTSENLFWKVEHLNVRLIPPPSTPSGPRRGVQPPSRAGARAPRAGHLRPPRHARGARRHRHRRRRPQGRPRAAWKPWRVYTERAAHCRFDRTSVNILLVFKGFFKGNILYSSAFLKIYKMI